MARKCKVVVDGKEVAVPARADGKPIWHVDMPQKDRDDSWDIATWLRKMVAKLQRDWTKQTLGPLVTVRHAADQLGISVAKVLGLVREGRLNGWKDPKSKRWWIKADEVE